MFLKVLRHIFQFINQKINYNLWQINDVYYEFICHKLILPSLVTNSQSNKTNLTGINSDKWQARARVWELLIGFESTVQDQRVILCPQCANRVFAFDIRLYSLITYPKMQSGLISIWLDCDPGLDDTFAIIYAAHAKQFHLLGVSTSPGNTCLINTTQNALDVLYNIGRKDVPVYAGSNSLIKGQMKLAEHMHGSNGLGGVHLPTSPEKANTVRSFQKIFQRISGHNEKIIWVNTGSLTNLCILLLTYPELKQKISKIVMMGGAIGRGNISPAAQFNVFFDPHAFDEVLRLKGSIPLVMIPLEVTHENMATQEVIDHFKRNESIPFAKAIYNMLEQFKIMYFNNYKFPYPPIHDPCTLFYILHPEEFEASKARIQVDTFPTSYGRTNVYFTNPHNPGIQIESTNWVTTHLKNEKTKFWDVMQKILDEIFSEQIQKQIDSQKS